MGRRRKRYVFVIRPSGEIRRLPKIKKRRVGQITAAQARYVRAAPDVTTRAARVVELRGDGPAAPPVTAPAAPPAAPPAPIEIEAEPPRRRIEEIPIEEPSFRGGVIHTWFKAIGTFGPLQDMKQTDSPDIVGEIDDDYQVPAAFYSNQSTILGQVKFPGNVPVETLIDRLNLALQFVGEERAGFDFRRIYPSWEYTWLLVETVGGRDRLLGRKLERGG